MYRGYLFVWDFMLLNVDAKEKEKDFYFGIVNVPTSSE